MGEAGETGGSGGDTDDLRQLLLFGIMTGEFSSDFKFDDRLIGKRFGTSRSVTRDALGSLAASGVLRREARIGTTSAHQPSIFDTSGMTMTSPGRAGRKHWVTDDVRSMPAPPLVAHDLDVAEGAAVTRIDRRTVLGHQTQSVWTIWTALPIPEAFQRDGFPEHLNWYATAAEMSGHTDFTVDRVSTVYRALLNDAETLGLEEGDPILFNARLTRTMSGRPVDRSFGRWGANQMLTYDRTTVHVTD